jgi:hypothetical protein
MRIEDTSSPESKPADCHPWALRPESIQFLKTEEENFPADDHGRENGERGIPDGFCKLLFRLLDGNKAFFRFLDDVFWSSGFIPTEWITVIHGADLAIRHVETHLHRFDPGTARIPPGSGKLGAAVFRRVVLLVLVKGVAAQLF